MRHLRVSRPGHAGILGKCVCNSRNALFIIRRMSTPPEIPVDPVLSYATEYVDTRRPGAIIAMGVLSIVFAVISGVMAAFSLLMAVGLSASSTRAGPVVITSSSTTVTPRSTALPSPDGVGAAQRGFVLDRVRELTTLSPARKDVLEAFLSEKGTDIDPRLSRLAGAEAATRMITAAGANDAGETIIDFNSGRLTVAEDHAVFEPTGTTDLIQLDLSTMNPRPGAPGFSLDGVSSIGRPYTVGTPAPLPKFGAASIGLSMANGIVSSILSLLLLIAAIFLLRSKPAGRRLHLWWAWLKMLGAILGGAAVFYFYYDIMTSVAATPGVPNSAAPAGVAAMMGLMTFGIGILYPIAVLIVMSLKSVKNYLSSMT